MVILANSAMTNCEAERRDVPCHQSKGFRKPIGISLKTSVFARHLQAGSNARASRQCLLWCWPPCAGSRERRPLSTSCFAAQKSQSS